MSRLAMTGAALVAFLAAMPAFAHVSADPANAAAGSSFRTSLRIPHGCNGQATTAVRVDIPDGILGVTPQAKPGWQVAIEKKPLPKPIEVAHGLDHPAALIRIADTSSTPGGGMMQGQMQMGQMQHGQMQHGQMQMGQPGAADAKPAATIGDIGIVAPFARATPAKVGGAFMRLTNSGKADDKLIRAAAPVAETVEIHEHAMEGGAMRMRPVDGIVIPAGGTAMLQPGGYHVMMIGLKQPLKQGDHFPLTLTFEKAGTVTVDVPVLTPGATGAAPAMPGGMKQHNMR